MRQANNVPHFLPTMSLSYGSFYCHGHISSYIEDDILNKIS